MNIWVSASLECEYDIVLNRPVGEDLLEYLEGFKIYVPDRPVSSEELWDIVSRSRVYINWFSRVDKHLLEKKGCLRLIIARSTGYDHIDIEYAEKENVCVANQPELINEAVAEFAVGGILAASRMIVHGHLYIQRWAEKGWPTHLRGLIIRGRSVGLLGAGRIGQSIAYKLAGLGAGPFYYYSRSRKPGLEAALGARYLSLEDLFKHSSILVNSLPLTRDTRGLVTKELLLKLPHGAIYVNIGRGQTEESMAVVEAARERPDLYFVLDVHPTEPLPPGDPRYELLDNPHVIMTPHFAGYSDESYIGTTILSFLQAKDYLVKGCVWNPVNRACRMCSSQSIGLDEALSLVRRQLALREIMDLLP